MEDQVEANGRHNVGAGPVAGQNDLSAGTHPLNSSPRLPWSAVTLRVAPLYLVGVLVMLGRLGAGVVWARRLVSESRVVADVVLMERFEM